MELEHSVRRLLDVVPDWLARLPLAERAVAADMVAGLFIDMQAARCLGYRGFGKLMGGGSAPEQALMKMFSSETRRRLGLIAAEVQGADAIATSPHAARGAFLGGDEASTWLEQYFRSFGLTISAGASEIQRNIIAEKVLGLPRS
jgi:alkylation response protein AidB-like acyl-CoA dehydrogenase